jgi:hypothetical protein
MRVRTNDRLVSKRRRLALFLSLGGIAVLGAGLAVNMFGIRSEAGGLSYTTLSYGALVVGTIVSWIGVSVSDRWTLPPRADLALESGLKGSGQAYKLYNWLLPAEHVLLAPWGLVLFVVYNCDGPVSIHGGRWKDARPWWRRAMSLGRRPVHEPSRLLSVETGALAAQIAARDESGDLDEVTMEGIAVFSRPGVQISVEMPSVPALRADDLGDWLRQKDKSANLSPARRRRLERLLDAMADEREAD